MMEKQSENPQANQEVTPPTPLEAHPDEIGSPDLDGFFSVLISPDDAVSISFSVTPKDETKAIGSISTGFFRSQGGVLITSIGGTNFSISPAVPGQKITGGTSEKASAFEPLPSGEIYEAILQGSLKKEGESAGSFFITKVVQMVPAEV